MAQGSIDIEKLLKHMKQGLKFLEGLPPIENSMKEWKRKELIELFSKDMRDFESVAKMPSDYLEPVTEEDGSKRKVTRSFSKVNLSKRLLEGELTIEIGSNGEVIIKKGNSKNLRMSKSAVPEQEVDFGVDEDVYHDTETVEQDPPKIAERPIKPKTATKLFSNIVKKAKVLSPLPDRKKSTHGGKLQMKASHSITSSEKQCAIKDGVLYYGMVENSPSQGKINLAGTSITEGPPTTYSFEITSLNATYVFYADSVKTCKKWVSELIVARDSAKSEPISQDSEESIEIGIDCIDKNCGEEGLDCMPPLATGQSTSDDTAYNANLDQAFSQLTDDLAGNDDNGGDGEKKGWMKRNSGIKSHKVWVVLSGSQLRIYRDDVDTDPKEDVCVFGARISTKGNRIDIALKDLKKGVSLAPVGKSNLPDSAWLKALAKAIQTVPDEQEIIDEDIYEEFVPEQSTQGDSQGSSMFSQLKGDMRSAFMNKITGLFTKSEEVQGTPTLSGKLWYREPGGDVYSENYFSIVRNFLVHYRSQADSKVLGRINLNKCYGLWLGPHGNRQSVFCLSNNGKKVHNFSISHPDEAETWLESLGYELLDASWCVHWEELEPDIDGIKHEKIYVSISPHPATDEGELELKQGQYVNILERTGSLWRCEKLDASNKPLGQSGYVTNDFLRPLYGSY